MEKVVLITGATDGLGRALALQLNGKYKLALCGRNVNKMNDLLSYLTGDVYYECFDITDEEKRNTFCQNVIKHFGTVDVLVNNAGANVKKDTVAEMNLEDLRYMFELNCVSGVGMIQQILPAMEKQESGLIVNVLSSCCLFHSSTMAGYTASKDAMEAISKVLLKEVKHENIGVCSVYPGGIDTSFRLVPNHNYLKPETVAKMIVACIENEEGCVHDIVIRPMIETNIA